MCMCAVRRNDACIICAVGRNAVYMCCGKDRRMYDMCCSYDTTCNINRQPAPSRNDHATINDYHMMPRLWRNAGSVDREPSGGDPGRCYGAGVPQVRHFFCLFFFPVFFLICCRSVY